MRMKGEMKDYDVGMVGQRGTGIGIGIGRRRRIGIRRVREGGTKP
jgi:hypothetical protein